MRPIAKVVLGAACGAAALCAAPAAHADQAVGEQLREAPIAAYAGWAAWSTYADGRYRLVLREPDGTVRDAPISTSSKPWDVSLGPDAHDEVVAIYQRCTSSGCDVRRLYVETGREQKLSSVSSPTYSEATPSIWRSVVAFTRRIRGCDVPYAKDLSSSAASRRLMKSKCVQAAPGQMAVRGTRILLSSVDLTGADGNGAGPKTAEIRRFSAKGGSSSQLLRQTFGEESNVYGQVSLDDTYLYTVHYGVHPTHAFVRRRLSGGSAEEVRAFRELTGAFARSDGTSFYAEIQGDAEGECETFTAIPCRVVAAPQDPFSTAERTLTPDLTVAYYPVRNATPQQGLNQPYQSDPLPFRGTLTQKVVSRGTLVRSEPLPGVAVELYRRGGSDPETFTATGQRGVTGPDGSYEIVLPPPIPAQPWYSAVAQTPPIATWAGRGTVGTAYPG